MGGETQGVAARADCERGDRMKKKAIERELRRIRRSQRRMRKHIMISQSAILRLIDDFYEIDGGGGGEEVEVAAPKLKVVGDG